MYPSPVLNRQSANSADRSVYKFYYYYYPPSPGNVSPGALQSLRIHALLYAGRLGSHYLFLPLA